jgi:hypothetical protein
MLVLSLQILYILYTNFAFRKSLNNHSDNLANHLLDSALYSKSSADMSSPNIVCWCIIAHNISYTMYFSTYYIIYLCYQL